MNPIEENAGRILVTLVEKKMEYADGKTIESITGISVEDLNDAIFYLEELGAVDVQKFLGTHPYDFGIVMVNARGRYLYHEMQEKEKEVKESEGKKLLPERPINPVGSPYGFTDEDWEFVSLRKRDKRTLYVVFGLKYESEYYKTDLLLDNIKGFFEQAVKSYNEKFPKNQVKLDFEKLTAGLGEHLFNAIARDIIGADIAVFEASDHNPNVMIELGVALTWGVRVLPLRETKSPILPSDISGQTWITHEDSGGKILEEKFVAKLENMIERAIAKK